MSSQGVRAALDFVGSAFVSGSTVESTSGQRAEANAKNGAVKKNIAGAASLPSMLNALLNGHAKARLAGQRAATNAKNGAVEKNRLPAVAADDAGEAALDSYLQKCINLCSVALSNDRLAYTHAVGEHTAKIEDAAGVLTSSSLSHKGDFVFPITVGDARRLLDAGIPLLLIGFELVGGRHAPVVAPAVAWLLRSAGGVDALAGQDGRSHARFPRRAVEGASSGSSQRYDAIAILDGSAKLERDL